MYITNICMSQFYMSHKFMYLTNPCISLSMYDTITCIPQIYVYDNPVYFTIYIPLIHVYHNSCTTQFMCNTIHISHNLLISHTLCTTQFMYPTIHKSPIIHDFYISKIFIFRNNLILYIYSNIL